LTAARRPVHGVEGQREQPAGLVGVVAAGGGERDADDELDQVVGAQVRAGGSGPLGVGQQVGRGTPDDAVAVDGGRVGVWTFAFDGQPAGRVREAAAEIEELGYGAI